MDSDGEMYDESVDCDLDMAQKNWSRISNGINKVILSILFYVTVNGVIQGSANCGPWATFKILF